MGKLVVGAARRPTVTVTPSASVWTYDDAVLKDKYETKGLAAWNFDVENRKPWPRGAPAR
jgi:hypothetical protein